MAPWSAALKDLEREGLTDEFGHVTAGAMYHMTEAGFKAADLLPPEFLSWAKKQTEEAMAI